MNDNYLDKAEIDDNSKHWENEDPINKYIDHKKQSFKIPLISKKMGKVQEYITEFDESTATQRDQKTARLNSIALSMHRRHLNPHHAPPLHPLHNFLGHSRLRDLHDQSCVKYDSINNQNSEQRIEKLARLEKDYSLLKEKLQTQTKYPSGQLNVRKNRELERKQEQISEADVQKEIRTFKIKENGRNYFADLYMLKKSRQNLIDSLSNAGKTAVGSQQASLLQAANKLSYEQKLKASQQQFVREKIMQERHQKKSKMMKGRNLHWNVYYDMLALSSNEKKKLKKVCKFTSTYGIV